MSATLRHKIGKDMANAIRAQDGQLLTRLGAQEGRKWVGSRLGGHWTCETFAIKLPQDIEHGYQLLRICRLLGGSHPDKRVVKGCQLLVRKLAASFGLPLDEPIGRSNSDERGFLVSIEAHPADLTPWSAYADWLQERNDPRSNLIAGWIDPKKALKVRYGVPELARGKLGLSHDEE
jgi:uncharacterized protein (TIGR02996 family)